MSQTQVEKEKREEKKEEEKEEKVIHEKKSVHRLPLDKITPQKIVRFKKVKACLPICVPRLKLTKLLLSKLVIKQSTRIVSNIIKSPHLILDELFKIRIPISKFLAMNSSKLVPTIISIIPLVQMKMPHVELNQVKVFKLVQKPKLKSDLVIFPSSKILLNETVKIQTPPTLSFEISKATTETMQRTETVPSKEEEIIEEIATIPLGEAEEPEDLFELLFDWEELEKLEKLQSALTSPTAMCVFLIPNNEVFQGELTIRKILATEFKRSYGEIDAKHDASSNLSDRGKNVVTVSRNKVEKLAKMTQRSRKRLFYER